MVERSLIGIVAAALESARGLSVCDGMVSHMETCPCGSDAAAETCCLPVIKGERVAKSAEEAMRSRYTAFTLGEIDWILESHHPETIHEINREDVEKWSTGSDWLEVGS